MHLTDNTLLQGGKYRIIRFISSGGFGCTYEAEHTRLRKRVAIKEFFVKDFCTRDESTSEVTVALKNKERLVDKLKTKFQDEAISISHLDHPNIVKVSDIFEENGTAYYVMDFVDGLSLHELVKRNGPIGEPQAVAYVLQVASALDYIHKRHRLHLDIKPGNIMVDAASKAILIDFGASKQYDEVDGENTSTLMGKTPGYAPLEQMTNNVQQFTPATDIYALGATLYKLLTGLTPPDPATVADGGLDLRAVSPALAPVIVKSMSLLKKDRYQSISQFVAAIDTPQPVVVAAEPENTVYENAPEPVVQARHVNGNPPVNAADRGSVADATPIKMDVMKYVLFGIISFFLAGGMDIYIGSRGANALSKMFAGALVLLTIFFFGKAVLNHNINIGKSLSKISVYAIAALVVFPVAFMMFRLYNCFYDVVITLESFEVLRLYPEFWMEFIKLVAINLSFTLLIPGTALLLSWRKFGIWFLAIGMILSCICLNFFGYALGMIRTVVFSLPMVILCIPGKDRITPYKHMDNKFDIKELAWVLLLPAFLIAYLLLDRYII